MKTLIAYFSWSNNTKRLVEEINKDFHYDVVRIERKAPYSTDYNQCAYVEAKGEWERRALPEIKDLGIDFSSYDRILLFFPIWWYTFPMPVGTFFKSLKGYKGKVIYFANSYTNDRKYMENSLKDLKAIDGSIDLEEGLFNKSAKEHVAYIAEKEE